MTQPKVVIHGKFEDGDLPAQGTLTFSDFAFSTDTVENVIHVPHTEKAYLDQNGEFWVELPLNVGINSTPTPRRYSVDIAVSGFADSWEFVLDPTSLQVELSSLMPVNAPPVIPYQYVSSLMGMTGPITYSDFIERVPQLAPDAGKSAYELWVDQGNTGSFSDFLDDISGPPGIMGPRGAQGDIGTEGPRGLRGPAGPQGRPFHLDAIVMTESALSGGGGVLTDDEQTVLMPKWSIVAVLENQSFYHFDGVEWRNLGSYKGAQGEPGNTPTAADLGLGTFVGLTPATMPIPGSVQIALNTLAANVGQVQSVNGQVGEVEIGADDVGLGNVANLAPSQMPVSADTQAALNALSVLLGGKEPLLPSGGTVTTFLRGDKSWRTLIPADVGLGQVRNFASMNVLGSVSLDAVTSTGTYHQPFDTVASTDLGYPVNRAGFLVVVANNDGTKMVAQSYTTYGYAGSESRVYLRAIYATNSWGPWRQVYTSSGADPFTAQSYRGTSGGGVSASGVVHARSFVASAGISAFDLDSAAGVTVSYPLAPVVGTLPDAFPQGYSVWRLQAGAAGSPTGYPVLSGTLESYRNTFYPRQRLTAVDGTVYTRTFSGTWSPWKVSDNLQFLAGQVAILPSAIDVPTSVVVNLPAGRFSVPPVTVVSANSSVPDRIHVSTQLATVDSFTVTMTRSSVANTFINWLAVGV
jgi:hypothetical protein